MKVRTGFVSNSSSASFVISKKHLTELQIVLIKNHMTIGKILGMDFKDYDGWAIYEDDEKDLINGHTVMNNFGMGIFLEKIGVDMDKVHWGD